jgi:hypothetical protein
MLGSLLPNSVVKQQESTRIEGADSVIKEWNCPQRLGTDTGVRKRTDIWQRSVTMGTGVFQLRTLVFRIFAPIIVSAVATFAFVFSLSDEIADRTRP